MEGLVFLSEREHGFTDCDRVEIAIRVIPVCLWLLRLASAFSRRSFSRSLLPLLLLLRLCALLLTSSRGFRTFRGCGRLTTHRAGLRAHHAWLRLGFARLWPWPLGARSRSGSFNTRHRSRYALGLRSLLLRSCRPLRLWR